MSNHEIPSGVSNPTTSLSDIPDFMKGAGASSEPLPARGHGIDPATSKRRLLIACAAAAAIVAVIVMCMTGSKSGGADADSSAPAAQAPAEAAE